MKDGKNAWILLTVVGIASVFNSIIALLRRSIKSKVHTGIMHPYVFNIHWATLIIPAAGVATLMLQRPRLRSEVAVIVVNFICVAICLSSIFTDCYNLTKYYSIKVKKYSPSTSEFVNLELLFVYNVIDFALCSVAAGVSSRIVVSRIEKSPKVPYVNVRFFQGAGALLCVLSFMGTIAQIFPSTDLDFIYFKTLDHFCWFVYLFGTGVAVFYCCRGKYLLHISVLVLCLIGVNPILYFFWLNYRVVLVNVGQRTRTVLFLFFIFGLPMVIFIVIFTVAFYIIKSERNFFEAVLNKKEKKIFLVVSFVFAFLALEEFVVDIIDLKSESLTIDEQKLLFLSLFTSFFSYLVYIGKFTSITLPAAITSALLGLNSTYLQVFGAIFTAYKETDVSVNGVETFFNVFAMVTCLCFIAFSMNISFNQTSRVMLETDLEEEARKRTYETRIKIVGYIFAGFSILSLVVSVFNAYMSNVNEHVLVMIHVEYYNIILSFVLLTFAVFQIFVSNGIFDRPLLEHTLLIINIIRFLESLTHFDYGDSMDRPWQWDVLIGVECGFITVLLILMAENPKNTMLQPAEISMDFENPLANGGLDENGYILLRDENAA